MVDNTEVPAGLRYINGLSHVYHCNHYNAHLQMAVLLSDGIPGVNPQALLSQTAARMVSTLHRFKYTKKDFLAEFTYCGFGILHENRPDLWEAVTSHYGQSTYIHGLPGRTCYFNCGFLTAITERTIEEAVCRHDGGSTDLYTVGKPTEILADPRINTPLITFVPDRFQFAECRVDRTSVDETAIIQAVSRLPLYGKSAAENGDGLIPYFGVVLANHYADYYNLITYETFNNMLSAGIPESVAREAFVQCGHVCAFNTFGGIMESPEWYSLVMPMCQTVTDWVHGIIAVINALGWGVWRLESITERQELVIRIYNSYEGIGYRTLYNACSKKEISFLAMGAVRGLAHLFWKIDIRSRPTLSDTFYHTTFNNRSGYWQVEQTHAIAAGDPYDRIVTRAG